ncbi:MULTISPECIES: translation initiation factor 2 [unclassified Pseudomonas]|uniref:translation initiation factor 2 n=1 Tax=unclassified Pseudomonas TaxID=196821 RepID=UPI0025D228B9|nr:MULTISPECIES: translation initiation factor 2 [unclassified Pseudomonas]
MMSLLGACDGDKAPAPPPKVADHAPAQQPDSKGQQLVAPAALAELEKTKAPSERDAKGALPVHELKPNGAVVPVVVASKPDPATSRAAKSEQLTAGTNAKSAKVKADNAEVAHRAPVSSKSKSASQVVKDTRLPEASLDLSLPPDMVKQLAPPPGVITAAAKPKSPGTAAKPLLPKMFPDSNSDPDFQLQGRLLSNEMQLQLRNEARKDVEGAALDFTFKQ